MDSITVSDMTFNYAFALAYNVLVVFLQKPSMPISVITMKNHFLYINYITFTFKVKYDSIHVNFEDPKDFYNFNGFPFAPPFVHRLFSSLIGE